MKWILENAELIGRFVITGWLCFTCYICGQMKGESDGFLKCLNEFHIPVMKEVKKTMDAMKAKMDGKTEEEQTDE